MKIIYLVPVFLFCIPYISVSYQEKFDLHKIVSNSNAKQFKELKKISIKDHKGFKFVKEHIGKDRFTSFTITKSTKHEISEGDKRKILEIIDKYK